MEYKFIYCNNQEIANKLMENLDLVNVQEISGKKTWIFENNNEILKFSNEIKTENLQFSNKMYI